MNYINFLTLIQNSKLIITDSGGIQEESCVMKVPSITLRTSTERQETIQMGANILSEYDSKNNIEYNDTDTNFKHLIENSTLEPFGKSIESPGDRKK